MAWSKSGTTTLTGTSDQINITDLTANTFNMVLVHALDTGNIASRLNLGSGSIDTGTNYASRVSESGVADTTQTSLAWISISEAEWSEHFTIAYIANIATEEKLVIQSNVTRSTAGAGSAPLRSERVAKWANTSNQFDHARSTNYGSGDYVTSSNLSALGSNGVESMTVQDGAVYYETDTNKAYVLYNNSWTEL